MNPAQSSKVEDGESVLSKRNATYKKQTRENFHSGKNNYQAPTLKQFLCYMVVTSVSALMRWIEW